LSHQHHHRHREHLQKVGPLLISAAVEASNFKFGTQVGFAEYQETGPKFEMVGVRGTSKKIWYTYVVCRVAYQKKDLNWRGSGLGEHPKKLETLHISATVEASNFKVGTQLGFGEYVT